MSQDTQRYSSRQIALVSLGSNATSFNCYNSRSIQKSISLISSILPGILAKSDLYVTPAFPAGSGPDFINAAISIETELGAHDVLKILHGVERQFGRERKTRWAQRTLDLDLLALGDQILPDRDGFAYWHDLPLEAQMQLEPEELILPHPRLHERCFVLVPLADVAPEWKHPVLGKTVQQMLDALPEAEKSEIERFS
ncbi:MAG: 2-amino-4-hydroxy-6-hydroxymethyldihydropteridine diphosphokinase [Pseudomonadota bacterium]